MCGERKEQICFRNWNKNHVTLQVFFTWVSFTQTEAKEKRHWKIWKGRKRCLSKWEWITGWRGHGGFWLDGDRTKGVGYMHGRQGSIVFSPGRIGRVEIKNRLVRSATYENAATTAGEVSDKLVAIYGALGKGGVGLIVTGITNVHPKGIVMGRTMRLDNACLRFFHRGQTSARMHTAA